MRLNLAVKRLSRFSGLDRQSMPSRLSGSDRRSEPRRTRKRAWGRDSLGQALRSIGTRDSGHRRAHTKTSDGSALENNRQFTAFRLLWHRRFCIKAPTIGALGNMGVLFHTCARCLRNRSLTLPARGEGATLNAPEGNAMTFQSARHDLTALLGRWRNGTTDDQEQLFAAVHGELRRVAGAYMRRERRDHTLQPTALVHEAYLRLVREPDVSWVDRAHFFGIAARLMRQILVDHARKRSAAKRKMLRTDRSVSQIADPAGGRDFDVLALHEALDEMANLDARQAEIVELRYFGGLTEQEVADLKNLSPATIRREIASARFWLGHRMKRRR